MSKINFKRSKPLLFVSLVILLGLIGMFLWLNKDTLFNSTGNVNPNSSQSGSQPTAEERKAQAAAELDSKREAIEGNPAVSDTTDQPQPQESAAVQVTAKTEKNRSVTLITRLTSITDGTCKLAIQNGTSTYADTAEVIYQPEYSTCAGFSVPIAQLGTGTWNMRLSVVTTEKTYTETISYKVE